MKTVNITDIYKKYVDRKYIKEKEYKKIIDMFFDFVLDKVFKGDFVFLPLRLGCLYVSGKKTKIKVVDGKVAGLAIDWKHTNENLKNGIDRRVYFLNEHTNGYRYKFIFSKKGAYVHNKLLYNFRLSKKRKRQLSKNILSGKYEYKLV